MAINYPTSLDSITDPTSGQKLNSPSHSGLHATVDQIAVALETKIGIDGATSTPLSSGYPALDYMVKSAGGWINANETWTYAANPVTHLYTFTVAADVTLKYQAGMKLKCTQGGSVKYFIITAVSTFVGGNTTITAYGGTTYTLGATITANFFSYARSPFGFPMDPNVWTESISDTSSQKQASPTQNTWYNLGTISLALPIGVWNINYQVSLGIDHTSATDSGVAYVTLSTANNSESDVDFTAGGDLLGASGTLGLHYMINRQKILNLAASATYYINTRTTASGVANIYNQNNWTKLWIRATSAYL